MRYLLDTHTLIWLFENNPQLSDRAKLIIVDELDSAKFFVEKKEHSYA